jgi:malonate transporter and related proteins
MSGVLAGFATIAVLIGFGMVLAHYKVVDQAGQRTLGAVAFYLASPALLFTTLLGSDLGRVFSGTVVALLAGIVATASVTIAVAVVRREDLGRTVIATMCSSYCNAGNLGLPIAAYVLGDTALIAPVLLLQLIVLQPLALTALDVAVSPVRLGLGRILSRPLRNPITVGSIAGLLVAVSGVTVPRVVLDPLTLVGGMAVPAMLLAYGVSLRLGPLPGRGVNAGDLGLAVGLKLIAQPLVAYAVGRLIGLSEPNLLAVTVISALPTAQNVFVIATRYDRGVLLARDTIFVSTIGCVLVTIAAVALVA